MDGYPHMETAASYIENHLAKYPQKANMEKRKFPEAMSFLKEIRQIMKNKDYIADQVLKLLDHFLTASSERRKRALRIPKKLWIPYESQRLQSSCWPSCNFQR